ncbi:hypothetical protein KFL_002270110 [Klebsormidium nitens]|uniref:Uncharacterized protein n=1 Tax=Klebsormidium nitens TaxID=105231 RepID=A0A1Y1I993_KLENI|nr:hypothetical protein KFL_002270110 [Klebsormidium nitens]|eukprot:GAQ85277.1 hypothetical protein KFL_002270110 [Klebsormidium nitens]
MAQPSHSEIPIASAAPPPAAYGENYKQEKQYTEYATPPYGQQYPPQAVPIAQGQPAYYAPQGQGYYPGQSMPGGGAYPPQQPSAFHVVQVPPHQPSRNQHCCATPDWIFFILGWIFGIFWPIGALLPLCRTPKFANPTVKAGWVANCIGTVLLIAAIIVIIVARPKSDDPYYRY